MNGGVDGGVAAVGVQVVVDELLVAVCSNLTSGGALGVLQDFSSGVSTSLPAINIASDSLDYPDSSSALIENVSLVRLEPDMLATFAMHASSSTFSHSSAFDLSKAPSSFAEAHAWSDASVWQAAMDWEKNSLEEMGAFEEADLPPGE